MSDEPLYCPKCGAEWVTCDCGPEAEGDYCHTCGVIPAKGKECKFYKAGGRNEECEPDKWLHAPLTDEELEAVEAADNDEDGEPW